MTAIQLGPQPIHPGFRHELPQPISPARLYDQPEPKLKLTPRLLGAVTAVSLLYAGGGMMLNLAGIEFTIPIFEEAPVISIEYTPLEIPIVTPKPPPTAAEPVTQAQPAPNTFMNNPTVTDDPVDTAPIELPTAIPNTVPDPGPIMTTTAAIPAVAPPPSVIKNPTWLTKPSPAQLGRLYPDRAAERGLRGSATMECRVTAQGTVNNCVVLRKSPTGYGFGEAALASTRYFKLNPRTVDGQAIEGARVQIPMGFNLAE